MDEFDKLQTALKKQRKASPSGPSQAIPDEWDRLQVALKSPKKVIPNTQPVQSVQSVVQQNTTDWRDIPKPKKNFITNAVEGFYEYRSKVKADTERKNRERLTPDQPEREAPKVTQGMIDALRESKSPLSKAIASMYRQPNALEKKINDPKVLEEIVKLKQGEPVPETPLQSIQKRTTDPGYKPSWGETIGYSTLGGLNDATNAYKNIPVLAEKVIDQGAQTVKNAATNLVDNFLYPPSRAARMMPEKQKPLEPTKLSWQNQQLENSIKQSQRQQAVLDQALAKAPVVQRTVGNIARANAAMAPAIVLGGATGMTPAVFGTQFGSQYAQEAENEGTSPTQALMYGAIGGAVETISGGILGRIAKRVGGKRALIRTLKDLASEGVEEVVANPITVIAKHMIYGNPNDDPIWDWGRELDAFVTGVGAAGTFAAPVGAINITNMSKRKQNLKTRMVFQVFSDLMKSGVIENEKEGLFAAGALVQQSLEANGGVNVGFMKEIAQLRRNLAAQRKQNNTGVPGDTSPMVDQAIIDSINANVVTSPPNVPSNSPETQVWIDQAADQPSPAASFHDMLTGNVQNMNPDDIVYKLYQHKEARTLAGERRPREGGGVLPGAVGPQPGTGQNSTGIENNSVRHAGREANRSLNINPTQNEPGNFMPKNDIPIEERNYEDVSKRNVNAYQYNHPEVADYIQAEAIRLIGEINDPTFFKGQKIVTKDPEDGTVFHKFGIKKNVSESFQRIQDATGASYGQIQKALEDIANNQGSENYALAKKIELIIDDNLLKGTVDIQGNRIEPDLEYVAKKKQVETQNGLQEKQWQQQKTESPKQDNRVAPTDIAGLKKAIIEINQGRVSEEQADALIELVNGVAKYKGISVDQYIQERITGLEQGGKLPEDALAALNPGVDPNQQVNVVDISNALPFKKAVPNKVLLGMIKNLASKNTHLSSADQKAILSILPNKAKHITYSSRRGMTQNELAIHKGSVFSIVDLMKNAVLIESVPNIKKVDKPNVNYYHNFYVPVMVNGKIHTIRLVAEEQQNVITVNPTDVALYDVIQANKKPVPYNRSASQGSGGVGTRTGFSISIKEMLKDVKDSQKNPFFPQQIDGKVKAAVVFDADNKAIIHAFQASNVADMAHELAHIFRRDLTPEDLRIAADWAGAKDGKWDRAAEEKFARGFEIYLREGKAPNEGLRAIFEKFKEWMMALYKHFKGEDLSPEIRQVFDRLVSGNKVETKGKVSGYADTGGYAEIEPEYIGKNADNADDTETKESKDVNAVAVELPEIIVLVQQLNEGKLPLLKAKLGKALGKFVISGEKGDIKLRRDIFIGERLGEMEFNPRKDYRQQTDAFVKKIYETFGQEGVVFKRDGKRLIAYHRNPNLAAKVLAHEIGHLVDWLPDKMMGRGNLLGRIASLKNYLKHILPERPGAPGELTEKDRRRLRTEAEKLAGEERKADEAGANGPTPADILAIWNDVNSREKNPELLAYISRLSGKEKARILREALKGMVNLPGFKESNYKDWTFRQKEIYKQLIRKEIAKRHLFELETTKAELKKLTQVWKPFNESVDPKYTKYRYSSAELYADAFSVLINNPSLLKKTAPNFYRAFFNYLESKPLVKAKYEDIQNRIGDKATLLNQRLDKTYQMFTEGHAKRNELNQRRLAKVKSIPDMLLAGLVDKNQGVLKLTRKYEGKKGTQADKAIKARYELEETSYISAEADNYVYELGQQVLKQLKDAGLTVDDLGVYLLHQRVINERSDMANPQGYGEKTSSDMLDALRNRLGADDYAKIEKAAKAYRKIREEMVIPRVAESRTFSKEIIEMMKSRKHYAKFSVQYYLDKTYGTGTTSRIFKQLGTIGDIENPLVVTVLNDLSMLRAAKINEAKLAVASFLREINNANTEALLDAKGRKLVSAQEMNIITPAETKFDGSIKEPKNQELALFQMMVDGEIHSFYVAKEIAKSFEYKPFEATRLAQLWGMVISPLKAALVSKNPIWMARNVIRDLRTTYKNVPELKGFRSVGSFLKYYRQSFKEVRRAVFKEERSEDLKTMYQNFMINPNRQYDSRERNFENDLERLANEFNTEIYDEKNVRGVKGRLKAFMNWLDKWGRVSEQTGKLAGYKFMTNKTNRSADEVAHIVRTRIGTPDVRRTGEWQQFTNGFFMFSNVNKEGWRATGESIKENPGAYVWKTLLTNFLPKLIIAGIGAGLMRTFGDDDDKWKKTVDTIPDYDKRSYNIIPLGMTKDGKAVYMRLPEDYEGQVFGSIAYTLFQGKLTGKGGVLSVTGEQLPYDYDNPNPWVEIGRDFMQYYIYHQNPVDEYRGRNILPQKVFDAGGWEASKKMLGHAWRGLGGSAIYTPSTDLDENWVQKIMKLPGFNIVGSFVKISDRGVMEKYYEEKDKETQEKAQQSLALENRIKFSVRRLKRTPTVDDAETLYDSLVEKGIISEEKSFAQFYRQQYLNYAGKAVKDRWLSMVMRARTKADRFELMQQAKEHLPAVMYKRLERNLSNLELYPEDWEPDE
jgi:hypothetical protein